MATIRRPRDLTTERSAISANSYLTADEPDSEGGKTIKIKQTNFMTWIQGIIVLSIARISGLQAALDAKSPVGHGHAISDVTGLAAALAGAGSGAVFATATNNSGDLTLTPAAGVGVYRAIITVGGSARTSNIILDVTGRTAGHRMSIRLDLTATAGVVLNFRDGSAGGTIVKAISSFTGDLTVAEIDVYFTGSAWSLGPWRQYMASEILTP